MKDELFDLEGRTAVVTGSTKGLGYGMAKMLAEHGANVVINSRHGADCERVAKELGSSGAEAWPCAADISRIDQIEALVDGAQRRFGRIDIMVNNAGVGITKPALEVAEAEWDYLMSVDLKGVFFSAQAAARVMRSQGSGVIVNIASLGGVVSSSRLVPYMCAKAGVIHMTKGLAVEWAKYNIRVNAVAPGYVLTPMSEDVLKDERSYKMLTGLTPMRRLGTVEEIAGVVLFLASDASGYMTGETVIVDGGRHAL